MTEYVSSKPVWVFQVLNRPFLPGASKSHVEHQVSFGSESRAKRVGNAPSSGHKCRRCKKSASSYWRRLDARIEGLSGEIETLARQDQHCERLMTIPGIGPIISTAMVAAIGIEDVFSKGRAASTNKGTEIRSYR